MHSEFAWFKLAHFDIDLAEPSRDSYFIEEGATANNKFFEINYLHQSIIFNVHGHKLNIMVQSDLMPTNILYQFIALLLQEQGRWSIKHLNLFEIRLKSRDLIYWISIN